MAKTQIDEDKGKTTTTRSMELINVMNKSREKLMQTHEIK